MSIHCTNEISLPVRPPTLLIELEIAGPALAIAELAEDETFVSPSEAFDDALPAVSVAFAADCEAALAASEVVEACRTGVWRRIRREGRSTARAVAADIATAWKVMKTPSRADSEG